MNTNAFATVWALKTERLKVREFEWNVRLKWSSVSGFSQ